MCKCPIEIAFDDNEFIRMEEDLSFCSTELDNEDATFSSQKDEKHQNPCIVFIEVLYCPECEMENERLSHIETVKNN
jgi:hypothetical protein